MKKILIIGIISLFLLASCNKRPNKTTPTSDIPSSTNPDTSQPSSTLPSTDTSSTDNTSDKDTDITSSTSPIGDYDDGKWEGKPF
ncbi:MAG: hypothetical protein ACI35S_09060 [Anaeroplasma sp.]